MGELFSSSLQYRLQYQFKTIGELIKCFPETMVKQRPAADKWSAFENIAHLASYQPVFMSRIETIIRENNPVFERYTADNDPSFNAYCKKPPAELLLNIQNKRNEICSLLFSLSAEQLMKKGRHPKFGNMNVTGWTEFFLLHEAHHLFTIFQITAALKQ